MVPHLVTALTGPINELEQRVLESMPATERWFRLEWMEHTPPFYSSVEIHNAGFKLAPVETQLFPNTFDHLTDAMMPLAVQAAMAAIEKICPEAKNLLLIPRLDHDPASLANVRSLVRIFTLAGLNVRLGARDESQTAPLRFDLPDGDALVVEPLLRTRRRLGLKDFDPCTILLNDDLSAGIPEALKGLHEQYLLPPLHAGWAVRRKSNHLRSYEEVSKKFAKLLGMDPWLIHPMYAPCGTVDWHAGVGLENVQTQVDALLTKIRRKHKEYGIGDKPFVVVKTDDGRPGMGVMAVRDAKELDEIARRTQGRTRGAKDGQAAFDVIVQEGVPTFERIDDVASEPVVYMIDRYVIGGFYKRERGEGADHDFSPLAFAESSHLPRPGEKLGASAPNRFYMYGVIGRLAMLAASYELEATDPEAEVYD